LGAYGAPAGDEIEPLKSVVSSGGPVSDYAAHALKDIQCLPDWTA